MVAWNLKHDEGAMIKSVYVVFFCFVLTGCASLGTQFKKAAEADETQARTRLRILAEQQSTIKAVPEMECLDWSSPKAGVVLGGGFSSGGYNDVDIDMPYAENRKDMYWAELYVAANKPISISYVGSGYRNKQYRCDLSITFVPKDNHDYELRARLIDVGRVSCTMNVVDLTSSERVDFSRTTQCK